MNNAPTGAPEPSDDAAQDVAPEDEAESETEEQAQEPVAVLVAFRPDAGAAARDAALSEAGLMRSPGAQNIHFARVVPRDGARMRSALAALRRDPRVRVAEPDLPVTVSAIPNDPNFAGQWELHNVGQIYGSVPDADIDAPEAWDIHTDCSSVPVAVIDTGVDHSDPDFQANIFRDQAGQVIGYDFVDDDSDPDDEGAWLNGVLVNHGTGVAARLGAVGNNGLLTTGVCQQASIMPVRVIGPGASLSTIIQGIDYAREHGARIMNLSLYFGPTFSQLAFEALDRARAAGVLVVAAAGNYSTNLDLTPAYPASYNRDLDNVIAVGASDYWDHSAGYSNHGLSVDIAAPTVSGTSFAAPFVAGAAALLAAAYPASSDYKALKRRVLAGVDHPAALAGRVRTGRLNLARSMEPDSVAPGAPSSLKITKRASSELALEWTASGDDGAAGGPASAYELRYSTMPIDDSSFESAAEVTQAMIPGAPGTPGGHVLTGLAPATTYYVALRAVDNAGNVSPVVSTPYGIRTSPAGVLLDDDAEGSPLAFSGPAPWATSTEDQVNGSTVYTDSPGAPMAPFTDSALTQLAPVLLSGQMPMLQFRAKQEMNMYDKLHVELSRDSGATWLPVRDPLYGHSAWRTHRVMMHAFRNEPVLVRFRLEVGNNADNLQGVWLDDIRITSAPAASCEVDDSAGGSTPAFQSTSWAASTEESFSPDHAYSDSPGAPYPPSSTRSLLQTGSLLLDRSDPWLAAATRTALGQGDLLTLMSSADGGTSWFIVPTEQQTYFTFLMGASPWRYRSTSLAQHRGQSFRLRWDLYSDEVDGGESGAWVDDIAVCSEPFEVIANPPPLPAQPANLDAYPTYGTQVIVSWQDQSKGETGYLLQRRSPGGQWTDALQRGPVPGAGSTAFHYDVVPTPGEYEYRLFAQGTFGAAAPVSTTSPCGNCQ